MTSAFPILERGGQGLELTHPGMTLRDYFAATALSAFVAKETDVSFSWDKTGYRKVAEMAYSLSDEILKVHNGENK